MYLKRLKTIIYLGIPITGGMLSQSLLNLVDTAMVGRLGEDALAAIGVANYAIFVSFALISGLSVAVQSRVARRFGSNNHDQLLEPVSTGVRATLFIGLPLTFILYLLAPMIIGLFRTEPSVAVLAENYFKIRILSLPSAMLMLCFRGFWNGCQSPLIYLKVLVFTHLVNICASYALIFGALGLPEMGLSGAAAGTLLAMYGGALMNNILLMRHARKQGIPNHRATHSHLHSLFQQAWPDSAQQTLFAMGTAVLFWLIAGLGKDAMAISHILVNISLLLILPGLGLGMAATTLINQALGAREVETAWRWGWDVALTAFGLLTLLSLPLLFFPEQVLGLFITTNDALIEQGVVPLQLLGLGVIIESIALVFTQALLGTGSNRQVLQIRFASLWVITLPLTWYFGIHLGFGLTVVWGIQLLQRLILSVAFASIWQSRHWQKAIA